MDCFAPLAMTADSELKSDAPGPNAERKLGHPRGVRLRVSTIPRVRPQIEKSNNLLTSRIGVSRDSKRYKARVKRDCLPVKCGGISVRAE
jgi:hypothetical protein